MSVSQQIYSNEWNTVAQTWKYVEIEHVSNLYNLYPLQPALLRLSVLQVLNKKPDTNHPV